MPTWVQIKTPKGPKLIPKEAYVRPRVHHIMCDIEPYRAVAGDQRVITSRSREREFLKEINCIQVGNEWNYFSKHGGKTPDNPTIGWGKE